jgi:oligopeptide transport system substrate-binding protein
MAVCAVLFSSCTVAERPQPNDVISATKPPVKQEFRWSNGKAPKSFDPAMATAPPETDIVRAVYEGLTELDPKTLDALPGVAESWENSPDFRTWTFHLRKEAKWSNGKSVTATDFVRSWKRLSEIEESPSRTKLIENIIGMRPKAHEEPYAEKQTPAANSPFDILGPPPPLNFNRSVKQAETPKPQAQPTPSGENLNPREIKPEKEEFGAIAKDDLTLEVKLIVGDSEFPKLVSHPVFRPIFGDGAEFGGAATAIVSNGAFRVADVSDGVLLKSSDGYWNKSAVKLENVRFVPKDNASDALDAYRAGELDVVTNAEFEPLALKLLAPYADFRRTTHAAINLYEFNDQIAPFNDRRVRQALALAIERERLAEVELEGSVRPAMRFLPFGGSTAVLSQDVDEAKENLESAGFPNGENFPTVRLVVNRNDTQLRIARLVARMWKDNLNISTDIVVKETGEMESVRKSGDYDLIRRGIVFPTSDSEANLRSLFETRSIEELALAERMFEKNRHAEFRAAEANVSRTNDSNASVKPSPEVSPVFAPQPFSEEDALYEMRAIPLYFPTSYSLVKPYVQGFDMNGLDSPSLRNVVIDNDWQP